ncbi:hypothetical protein KRE42_16050, partial [Elizabethkingia meningoseptica]|uniref:hypothetical protein n=1 Tax=Elizabethkingia meningoseptica TaxID=238 RepID=UPI001C876505
LTIEDHLCLRQKHPRHEHTHGIKLFTFKHDDLVLKINNYFFFAFRFYVFCDFQTFHIIDSIERLGRLSEE